MAALGSKETSFSGGLLADLGLIGRVESFTAIVVYIVSNVRQ